MPSNEIIKEMCWSPGFECGECGCWVTNDNSLLCEGLCEELMKEYKDAS